MAKRNKFATALKKENLAASVASRETPSRRGTKHIGGYFDPEVSRQLRQIAVNEDTSIQSLLAESLNMLFHSRKMPTIA